MDDDDPTIQIADSFLPALSPERARQIMQQNRPSQSELSGNAMDAEQMKKVVQRKSPAKHKTPHRATGVCIETATAATVTITAATITSSSAAASVTSSSVATTATSVMATSSELVEDQAVDSVGPDRVPGYGHVMDLAEYCLI
ncbi:hypothetical protein DPMN_073245 [Dreissena polymorpha]|uniref:Uncharacterized protein n=1 Tax=Dreissena polymorpha TaxID=45954 RepID=A0A9D4BYV1_DREPO|nr:hypothetical protein DPMN_073245 [Dreissena polymorpha]